jgi:peptidoglycan/LPS O-acetylase OafA/YrhL
MTTSTPPTKATYRPDIDGLRAIAVLSVILFHLDKHLLPGGFVGVDIFFVISGFLISLHIMQEIAAGKFSIVEFYRRRVKRIAPPMLLVVFLTVLVAQTILLPEDARATAQSAFWSLLSLANVYFWRHLDTSYFAAPSGQLPLLHLWSLGVEEQFYIFWPLLLLAIFSRVRGRTMLVLATTAALTSFTFAQFWFTHDSAFVYYMLPTRAGELLAGALVAIAVLHHIEGRMPKVLIVPLAIIGLTLTLGSLWLLTDEVVFPGLFAIPPTLGAALLILAGHCDRNRVSSLLAFKPLVWVGLVSYSAYLWHWPLLAFFRYGHDSVGLIPGSAIFASTFALAWLTYEFVERPTRASRASAVRIFLFQYIIPATAIALIAQSAMQLDGYGLRGQSTDYKAQLGALQNRTRPAYEYDYVCQRQRATANDVRNPRCVLGANSATPPEVLLWGDSNAAHYIGAIAVIAQHAGFNFRNIALGSCPPLETDPAPFVASTRLQDCRASAEPVLAAVRAAKVVIISASWSSYQHQSPEFLDKFFATARSLANSGKFVILIGKAPSFPSYDRRCHEKALSYPLLSCPKTSAPLDPDVMSANNQLRSFSDRTPNVAFFDVSPYFCHDGACSPYDAAGNPLYYDQSHLSMPSSWKLGERIIRQDGVPTSFARITPWLQSASHSKDKSAIH